MVCDVKVSRQYNLIPHNYASIRIKMYRHKQRGHEKKNKQVNWFEA